MAYNNFDKVEYEGNNYYPRDTKTSLVMGTQTGSTNAWTGALPEGINSYTDPENLIIDYFLPYDGTSGNATLNLSGLGAKPIYTSHGTSPITDEFEAKSVIRLAYVIDSALNSGNGAWKVVGSDASGSGGSVSTSIGEADATSTTASISFTGITSEPTSFYICYVGQSYISIPTGTPYKTVNVVYDGTNTFGNIATSTNNAQASYSSDFSYTYSNDTLTVTGTASNFIGPYHIIYTYGSSTAAIHTEDVQVGSGVTSITFTGLKEEPAYWSCAFKGNFGTNTQNYKNVMSIGYGYNGDLIIGYAVGADISIGNWWTWSYSYSNSSLTITSQGANSGGYFYQPGYYQLTFAYKGGVDISVTKETIGTIGSNSWSAGTLPTLTTDTITADDITDYTQGVPTNISITGGVMTLTYGTPTTVTFTSRTIKSVNQFTQGTAPSLTAENKSVVTNVTSS